MNKLRPCLAAAALACAVAVPARATDLLVPAYFYPSFDPAQNLWTQLTAAAASGAQVTAIMNVDNGPGSALNSDYLSATQAFRAAGGRLLGYVYTCYGGTQCASGLPATRTTTEVLAQAQQYAQWYGVDGIFLDEMSNQLQDLPFYSTIASSLRSTQPQWQIVGNPGTATPADYLAVADTLVTYENGSGSYVGAPSEPWMGSATPDRQAHLFYNVAGTAAMQSLLLQAQAHGAGYVYLTDDRYTPGSPTDTNPWDALPSYWAAELAAVSTVPEPSVAALALAGLGLMGWRLRRSQPGLAFTQTDR